MVRRGMARGWRRTGSLLALVLATAGCNETHFQSPPGELKACDSRFVGSWALVDPEKPVARCDDKSECAGVVTIAPECREWHSHEPYGPEGEGAELDSTRDEGRHMQLRFADVRGRNIVVLVVDTDTDSSTPRAVDWPREYLLWRYELRGASILLYPIDDATIAQLIARGGVHGRTIKSQTQRSVHEFPDTNHYVYGDPREIARIVLLPHVFADKPIAMLKPADPADIVKPALSAPSP